MRFRFVAPTFQSRKISSLGNRCYIFPTIPYPLSSEAYLHFSSVLKCPECFFRALALRQSVIRSDEGLTLETSAL